MGFTPARLDQRCEEQAAELLHTKSPAARGKEFARMTLPAPSLDHPAMAHKRPITTSNDTAWHLRPC